MSFLRKQTRKIKKQANKGDRRAVREYMQARQSIKVSYVNQIIRDREYRKEVIHNLLACFLLTMHENYGFGSGRLLQLRGKMQSEFDAIVGGYVSVEEIATFLKQEIGLNVGIDEQDPNATHDRQIEFRVIKEMSSAFLMALLDEFYWKKKALAKAYNNVFALSEAVGAGEITYPEICDKVNKVFKRKPVNRSGGLKAITHSELTAGA